MAVVVVVVVIVAAVVVAAEAAAVAASFLPHIPSLKLVEGVFFAQSQGLS